MESNVYSLIKPYQIKEVTKPKMIKEDWVVVKPSLAAVCHADLRYFTGSRSQEVLDKKLPMALIHEGVGVVVDSKDTNFTAGDRVIIVPNIPGRVFGHEEAKDTNKYSRNGRFMGSGYDGIAQSHILHPGECLVKIPDEIPEELALLAEMSSVGISAIREIEDYLLDPTTKVAVFGDGPVGYFAAAYIHHSYGMNQDRLTVFGADDNKLSSFDFAHTDNVVTNSLEAYAKQFDVVIECTGGKFSENAINQAIDVLDYRGKLVLMGVTEERVPINTRDVLEKGLTLYGSSRSDAEDFERYVDLLDRSEDYQRDLKKILPDAYVEVANGEDFMKVMNYAADTPHWKKVVMKFIWDKGEE